MKKHLLIIAFICSAATSFGQLQLGQPNSKVQMNGIWSLMRNQPYSASDSFLIYTKYQIDSLFGVIVGTPSFSFVNGGNGFSGYRSVLGNNNNIHLDVFTNSLRRMRISSAGFVTVGDSSIAINVGYAGNFILGNTFFGYHAGDSARGASTSNTYIGSLSGRNDTSCIGCTFIGNSTGKDNRGNYNNFGGYNVGGANTTGTQNAAWGAQAFTANTTGQGNVAVGYAAFGANTTGNFGTAIGTFSFTASSGGSNVGVGYGTGQSAGTASSNVAVGTFGMNHCGTCALNVAVGHQSRYTATAGDQNVAIGAFALDSTNWYGNVAIGHMAGRREKGRGKLYIADSIDRNLIYGDFLNNMLLIGSTSGTPSFLSGDRFQINGTTYLSDTLKTPNIARKLLDSTNFKLVVVDASGNHFKTDWPTFGGGSGITSLNTLTGSSQTFATGTSGTDFGINSAGTIHTFNIPDASNTARGLITIGPQNINGVKTFSNPFKVINMVQGSSSDSGVVRASDGTFKVVSPNNPLNVNDVGSGRAMQYASGDSLHIRSLLVNGAVPDTTSGGAVNIITGTSGVYKPTVANVLNTGTLSVDSFFYQQIGRVVHVSGFVTCIVASNNSGTEISFTLPVAATLGANDLYGVANIQNPDGSYSAAMVYRNGTDHTKGSIAGKCGAGTTSTETTYLRFECTYKAY